MGKFKNKIKKILFTDENEVQEDGFTTKREMIYFIGMVTSILILVLTIMFTTIIMSMCKDLVNVVESDKTEISKLEDLNNFYSSEMARYKMMYEDLYDMYVYPQEQREAGVNND